jgi:biopolymer transport protein ExbB
LPPIRQRRQALAGLDNFMDITRIINAFGYVIYAALALLAIWGVYNAIMLYRSLAKKSVADAGPLLKQIRSLLQAGKTDAAIVACQEPAYWHTALVQLFAVALANRDKGIAKIKQLLVMEFHTEVIAGMENRLASISTIVRMGPLLGLLGTVASMIGAFGRIGGAEKVSPNALAHDISLALWATGSGLLIATPMMIVGNDVHARLRRLRDRTERQLQDFLEMLEAPEVAAARSGAARGGATAAPGSAAAPAAARAILPGK